MFVYSPKVLCLAFSLWFSALALQAQSFKQADSLKVLLRQSRLDTNRVNLLIGLAQVYAREQPDTAFVYARQAEAVSRTLPLPVEQANGLHKAAQVYLTLYKFTEAISCFEAELQLRTTLGDPKGIAEAYKNIGKAQAKIGDYPAAITGLEEALRRYRQIKELKGEIDVLSNMGTVYFFQGDYTRALAHYQPALTISRKLHDKPAIASLLRNLGNVYKKQNRYTIALDCYVQSLKMYDELANPLDQAKTLSNMSNLYADNNELEKAQDVQLKALKIFEQLKHTEAIAASQHNIALNYLLMKQYRKALPYFQEALQGSRNIKNEHLTGLILVELGRLYQQLGQPEKATASIQQGLALFQQLGEEPNVLLALVSLGTIYNEQRRYDQADELLRKALPLATRLGEPSTRIDIYQQLYKLNAARDRGAAALANFENYLAIKDSLFDQQKAKQLSELQVQYQTEKKEQEIKLLNEVNKLQQAEISAKTFARNATFGGAVLLLGLLGLVYNRYQLKRRANRLLENKQNEINHQNHNLAQLLREKDGLIKQKEGLVTQKEMLVKEIHHRVKNNLQVVMSLLYLQSRNLRDEAAVAAVQESQHRVHAMALLHDQLYQGDQVSQIDAEEYINELVDYLTESFDTRVTIQLDVESLLLDISQAVPLGLIINEAVTNAFKYAFPAGQAGTVQVSLHRMDSRTLSLTVRDNGVGLPANYDPARSRSLGMSLMHRLAQQLNGQLTLDRQSGVALRISFEETRIPENHAQAA